MKKNDLRILKKGCCYKVLDSQQFKDDADGCFSSIEELEEMIDENSDFIYIKIISMGISKNEDIMHDNIKVGDIIPSVEIESNEEYLDNEDYFLSYEIEVWGNFHNSCFQGCLAETGEYEKVTDLSFMGRLKKFI